MLLPRIIDKCRAEFLGLIGEYLCGEGLGRYFFEFVGLRMIERLHSARDDIKTRFDLLDLDDHCHFGGLA